jgi:hypothetical protein
MLHSNKNCDARRVSSSAAHPCTPRKVGGGEGAGRDFIGADKRWVKGQQQSHCDSLFPRRRGEAPAERTNERVCLYLAGKGNHDGWRW